MKKYVFSILVLLCFNFSEAQTLTINNVKATQVDGTATITYDLAAAPSQTHYVKLLYSTDGGSTFSNELVYASGDVRASVTGGIGKKIVWNSKQEVGSLSGNIVFKVTVEGRAKLPKPIENEKLKLEILNIGRSNGLLTIQLQVNPKKDMEHFCFDANNSYLIDNKANKANLAEHTERKQLVTGIPYKLDIAFRGVTADATSLALFQLADNHQGSNQYVFRNIPLPSEN
jgi:hypothetical protein